MERDTSFHFHMYVVLKTKIIEPVKRVRTKPVCTSKNNDAENI